MKSIFLRVRKTKGNIFAMLFAAVGMTGVLGVVGMQTVSGPITTITKVTQKNIVDTDLMTNARIVILNAGIQAAGGDADGDNYVEPAPYNTTCTANPTGGGCLPTDIGAIQTDPWGTSYGYCVWDHGLTTGSANRLQGKDSTSEPVIAIISAGRDKTFQTSCEPFDGSAPEGLQQVTTSDDSVRIYSYDAAVAGANGLWQIKDGDPNTAEIVKDLEIGDDGFGNSIFDFDTGTGRGTFPAVITDSLIAYTGNNVAVDGGLRLDDEGSVTSCGAADSGVIRYNTTDKIIEVCDGAGDWDGADETALIDEDGDTRVQVEEGVDDDTIRFDTTGVERAIIEPDGDVAIDTDTLFVDAVNGRVGIGITNAHGKLHVRGGHIVLDSNGDDDAGFIMQGADNKGIGLSSNFARLPNADLYVENNGDVWADTDTLFVDASTDRVGIGTITPDYMLEVAGTAGVRQKMIFKTATSGTWGGIDVPDGGYRMHFGNLIAGNVNPRMTVDLNAGNVGIGTTTPGKKLEISHAAGWDGIYLRETGVSNEGFLIHHFGGPGSGTTIFQEGNLPLRFYTNGAERVRIHGNGNVGIGETSPDTLLDVDGPIEIGAGTCNASGHGRLQYTALNNIQYCNGSSWQTITGAVASLNDIGDVNVTGVTTGQTIKWDGTKWVATSSLGTVETGDTAILIDNDKDTKIQVEEGTDDDTIRFDTAGTQRMVILPTGHVEVNGYIAAGSGSGGVAMTHNDGYGNANLTFNHLSGTPEQNGNAGRISVNTDATSGAYMAFQLKDNVANGVATALNDVMYLRSDGRVGISNNDTDGTLTITGAPNISSANTAGQGGIVIQDVTGNASGAKLRIDANALQTSSGGAATTMYLNPYGGNINIGQSGTSRLDMNGGRIIDLADPTAAQNAATKAYVDNAITSGDVDNADTVDGLHAASFIRSDANDNVSGHTEWQDNMSVRLGNGADFQMYHDGTDTRMDSNLNGARWILRGRDSGGTFNNMIIAIPNNSVNLYYAGNIKARTTATGLRFQGVAGAAPTK